MPSIQFGTSRVRSYARTSATTPTTVCQCFVPTKRTRRPMGFSPSQNRRAVEAVTIATGAPI